MRIPFLSTPDRPLSSTTQDFLPVADIVDSLVIYKDGGAALIMQSTSLNFSLLSENEQEAVIAAYAGMVNSFKFPVQIVVRSQKKDISKYLELLESAKAKIKKQQLAELMDDYKNFVTNVIKKQNVLSKSFYVIIPFTPYELGITKSISTQLLPTAKGKPLPFPKSYVIRKAKIALYPKRDHLMHQAGRVGLELRPLGEEELLKLLHTIYNPEPPVKERELFG